MKRILAIVSALCVVGLTPAFSYTAPVSHKSTTSPTPNPKSTSDAAKKAAHDTYLTAIARAKNGRDLALADAKATLLQSLAASGKDKVARKVAQDAYKASAASIIADFNKSVEVSAQIYRHALAAIK
jgi:hypothetical protein